EMVSEEASMNAQPGVLLNILPPVREEQLERRGPFPDVALLVGLCVDPIGPEELVDRQSETDAGQRPQVIADAGRVFPAETIGSVPADDVRIEAIVRGGRAPSRGKTAVDDLLGILVDDVLQEQIRLGIDIRWLEGGFMCDGAQAGGA